MSKRIETIAIIGGTGALGTGLARRWCQAGYRVIIGSRTKDKAQQALTQLAETMEARGAKVDRALAMENKHAAEAADLIVLTVPFAHQLSTLQIIKEAAQGKILVDVTVPLVPPKVARVQLPELGSAAQGAQALLGDDVRVVSAFQNVAAAHLQDEHSLDCDVLVTGNNVAAREEVIKLCEVAGMRGIHAGPLANAAAAEALTSLLIGINKRYKCQAGIRITGIA